MAVLFAAPLGLAQFGRKTSASKGPRAVALLELAANGKGHIVPVVIMDEGKFYDASAYKAAPVPMALDSGTVYEAEKTGVSLGLFSVSGALHTNDNRWIGAGTWEAAGSTPKKKAAEPKKHTDDELGGPPVLHRPGAEQPKAPPTPPEAKTPPTPPAPTAVATPPTPATPAASETRSPDDPNRPMLRRGKPAAAQEDQEVEQPPVAKPAAAKAGAPAATAAAQTVQVIPAISDSSGPEPRSFVYSTKPDEMDVFRKKMIALVSAELRTYEKRAVEPVGVQTPATPKARSARAVRTPAPNFEDEQLQIFDLAASNEPVLVFSAKALPEKAAATADLQYFVTVVAREDIYGDLHKVSAKITDTQHMDALPRYELIDAVDVDGDGRGELMFRQISDAGKAFAIYRVIGDQLWPLYEGAPQ